MIDYLQIAKSSTLFLQSPSLQYDQLIINDSNQPVTSTDNCFRLVEINICTHQTSLPDLLVVSRMMLSISMLTKLQIAISDYLPLLRIHWWSLGIISDTGCQIFNLIVDLKSSNISYLCSIQIQIIHTVVPSICISNSRDLSHFISLQQLRSRVDQRTTTSPTCRFISWWSGITLAAGPCYIKANVAGRKPI